MVVAHAYDFLNSKNMKKERTNYERINRRMGILNIIMMTFMSLTCIASCCSASESGNNKNNKSIVTEHHKYVQHNDSYLYCIETYVIDGYKFYVFCRNGQIQVIPEAMCKDKSETSSSNSWLY